MHLLLVLELRPRQIRSWKRQKPFRLSHAILFESPKICFQQSSRGSTHPNISKQTSNYKLMWLTMRLKHSTKLLQFITSRRSENTVLLIPQSADISFTDDNRNLEIQQFFTEIFILFFQLHSCSDCRKLSQTKSPNIKKWPGNSKPFYSL